MSIHFGPGYSPSPHLLIAALAPRTRTLRLGVMGGRAAVYQPWRVIEEIGMLDHLTGGRLEIGTSSGIPQEMALIGLDVAEASARNAEAQAILDAGLRDGIVNHHGHYWHIENLRLVPRPFQQPFAPEVDHGREHGIRPPVGATRIEDLHELSSHRAYPPHLRRVP